jgi:GNAT superfamily N-acetyltransferase
VISIPEATEVFVHGYCFMRSFARPYVAARLDDLWVLRDGPCATPARRLTPRKTEVIAHGGAPAEVVGKIRSAGLGWHFLCHLHAPDAPFEAIRGDYKAAGYRALATEWLFAHDLAAVPSHASDPPVRRVRAVEEAERIRRVTRRKPIRDQDLGAEPAAQRLYAVMDENDAHGWVSSIRVGRRAWVANLHVQPRQRGQGFGRALMSALLQDDRAHGIATSVLLASTAGARLYPHLGYRQIGVLQMFCPRRGR